jgi:hypothetical protein
VRLDRDMLLTLDKLSSVGPFTIGLTALAETCGVAVHSILTVNGMAFHFIHLEEIRRLRRYLRQGLDSTKH